MVLGESWVSLKNPERQSEQVWGLLTPVCEVRMSVQYFATSSTSSCRCDRLRDPVEGEVAKRACEKFRRSVARPRAALTMEYAIFSLINAVMLRTFPVKDPGQLVLMKSGSGPAFRGGEVHSDVPLAPKPTATPFRDQAIVQKRTGALTHGQFFVAVRQHLSTESVV